MPSLNKQIHHVSWTLVERKIWIRDYVVVAAVCSSMLLRRGYNAHVPWSVGTAIINKSNDPAATMIIPLKQRRIRRRIVDDRHLSSRNTFKERCQVLHGRKSVEVINIYRNGSAPRRHRYTFCQASSVPPFDHGETIVVR